MLPLLLRIMAQRGLEIKEFWCWAQGRCVNTPGKPAIAPPRVDVLPDVMCRIFSQAACAEAA